MQYHNIWIRNSEDGNMTLVMSLDLLVMKENNSIYMKMGKVFPKIGVHSRNY